MPHLIDLLAYGLIALATAIIVLYVAGLRVPVTRGWDAFLDGLRRARIWHLALGICVMTLFLAMLDRRSRFSGLPQLLGLAVVVILFVGSWLREFFFLMGLRDQDLPGRFDKPIWTAVLIVLAPIGFLLFRSYRLNRWPEPEPKSRMAPPARELS